MNFIFERSEWVKYCFCHEKIKFISSSRRVMFFLLYRHAYDGVFDDFPKISDHLPKFSTGIILNRGLFLWLFNRFCPWNTCTYFRLGTGNNMTFYVRGVLSQSTDLKFCLEFVQIAVNNCWHCLPYLVTTGTITRVPILLAFCFTAV